MSKFARRVVSVGVAALVLVGLGVTPAAADVDITGSLDTLTEMRDGAYSVSGWRFADDGGPVAIHVYDDGPSRTVATDLGAPRSPRDDVTAVFGRSGTGFERSLSTAEPGLHRVCVFAVAVRSTGSTAVLLGCREFTAGRAPIAAFDDVTAQVVQGDPVIVRGWAFDPDQPQMQVPLHAYGQGGTVLSTGLPRPGVAAAFAGAGPDQGFIGTVSNGLVEDAEFPGASLTVGRKNMCLFAIGLGAGGNTPLGCRSFEVLPKVRANLDSVTTPSLGLVGVSGWSYLAGEPSASTANELVAVSQFHDGEFGVVATTFPADQSRADVDRAFAGAGGNHGYAAVTSTILGPGPFSACVTTRRPTVPAAVDDPWEQERCGQFEMPNALGAVDSVTLGEAGPGTATIRGWAIDPTHPSATVALEVGLTPRPNRGQWRADEVTSSSGVERPDVNAAFGVSGAHGFEVVVAIPEGSVGRAEACVQAAVYASLPACRAAFASRTETVG